jgi:hypothetical protein
VSVAVRIGFRINTDLEVTLRLLDTQGRALKTLAARSFTAGEHFVEADVSELRPGIYLYQIKAGHLAETKKMVVTR